MPEPRDLQPGDPVVVVGTFARYARPGLSGERYVVVDLGESAAIVVRESAVQRNRCAVVAGMMRRHADTLEQFVGLCSQSESLRRYADLLENA